MGQVKAVHVDIPETHEVLKGTISSLGNHFIYGWCLECSFTIGVWSYYAYDAAKLAEDFCFNINAWE